MVTSAEKRMAAVQERLQARMATAGELEGALDNGQLALVQETSTAFADEMQKMGVQLDKVEATWGKQLNVWRRAGVDVSGVLTGPIFNTVLIEIIRRISKWSAANSKDGAGFWATQGDLMAGAVPLGLGLMGWVVDLALKNRAWKKYQAITIKHEVAGEIAKSLATLGMGTLSKAVVARWVEGKQVAVDKAASEAENAKLRELLATARAQLDANKKTP